MIYDFSAQRGIERADDESANDMSQSDEIERGRNGNDLTKIIETLLPSFDKFSIWQYGCNCQFLMSGDRPMSHPGYGRPVDALDRICKVSINSQFPNSGFFSKNNKNRRNYM